VCSSLAAVIGGAHPVTECGRGLAGWEKFKNLIWEQLHHSHIEHQTTIQSRQHSLPDGEFSQSIRRSESPLPPVLLIQASVNPSYPTLQFSMAKLRTQIVSVFPEVSATGRE
jgi:hypothetical protein